MFDLERAIAEWRAGLSAGGIKSPAVLDELECHLREEVRSRKKVGVADEHAFREALARMGKADALRDEFRKVENPNGRFGTWSFILWLSLAGLVAVYLGNRLMDGRVGGLLAAHIFTLTTGYLAAFLAGGLAATYVCMQWAGETSSPVKSQLASASSRFTDLAAGLIIVGFVLGLLWSGKHNGSYWTKNVREIGALTALVSVVVLAVVRRIRHLSEETRVLFGLGASLVVGFAWFGIMLLIAHNQMLFSWWPLDVFAAVHLLFIALSFARKQRQALI